MTQRLPPRESLAVEFKSERSKHLIEALVCLAIAEGGELWLGFDDNGPPPHYTSR